ncbi:(2Fe-2S) ferredoxin domain-containing protein [Leptodesmis sp.]|uniref:(2Fe-2S) ferredoxin domain-containing protein n=1 Tax=Leptodesmis sp. TaxID=3100501 RepID=UPI0040535497
MVHLSPSAETSPHYVWICQSRACSRQGAAKVLQAFQANPVPGVVVMASPCMGQCGNGPMVRVVPENVWYWRVCPEEVPAIVRCHLQGGEPVKAILYPIH